MEQMDFSPVRVLLLAADCGNFDLEKSLLELRSLAESAGYEPVGSICQKRDAPDNSSYLGQGRLAEARITSENLGCSLCIFNDELTGMQLKNAENAIGIPVIDRTMLILEIFEKRAVTKEGKYQTELARLQYKLPRLTGSNDALSRQGGGGAGGGGARRGSGESKLEYDRRYLRKRISHLKIKLRQLEKQRNIMRKSRQKNHVPVVALVGYTNVGKSSLLNRLTQSDAAVKDMLFATLDPTARACCLPNGLDVIFVDTVGFVSRLPHNLVEAFKSTLEEAKFADLILKVCDAGDMEAFMQLEVTDQVLRNLGCEAIPQITVCNKCDIKGSLLFEKDAVYVSAKTGKGLDTLLKRIQEQLSMRMTFVEVLLPYDKAALAACLYEDGRVIQEEYQPDGIYMKAIVKKEQAKKFAVYSLQI